MKKFSRLVALSLGAALIASFLLACGSKQVEDMAQSEDKLVKEENIIKKTRETKQQVVTIRSVSQFAGTDPGAAIYQVKLKEFQAENPNITLEDESAVADAVWKAKVAADFAANNEPDVIFGFTGTDAKRIIEQGKVVSLEEIREEFDDYAKNIPQSVLKLVEAFDGKTYAVPVKGFYQGLFVNESLFEKHEIDLPTDWQKLENAISILKEKEIIPVAVALGDVPNYWIEHLIMSQGGIEVHKNQEIEAVKVDWIRALEYFKKLYEMGAFPQNTNALKNDAVIEMFVKGNAGMLLETSTTKEQFEGLDHITVLPIPSITNQNKNSINIVGGFPAGWYITRKAWNDPAKRLALVKFVEKMISTQTMDQFAGPGEIPLTDLEESFLIQAQAGHIDMPIESWLGKSAWNQLRSSIPAIATGEEDITKVIEEVIDLNKK